MDDAPGAPPATLSEIDQGDSRAAGRELAVSAPMAAALGGRRG
jgi:hypothetical protein